MNDGFSLDPVRRSYSQPVSLIQRALITLVLRLIMNDGFRSTLCAQVILSQFLLFNVH